ncbi:uncharacterized protein [Eurosta solidaginis]|uniref:uncharacterized protein n=1 Tax=Eurosta solidaginis TaxID=178769 RepID=UPI0035317BC9
MNKFVIRTNEENEFPVTNADSAEVEATDEADGNGRIKWLSLVWKYFKKSTDKKLAKCLICQKEYRTSGNTCNLRDHLKRMHPNMENENDRCSSGSSSILSSMRSVDSQFKRGAEYDPTASRKKKLIRLWLD